MTTVRQLRESRRKQFCARGTGLITSVSTLIRDMRLVIEVPALAGGTSGATSIATFQSIGRVSSCDGT